MYWLTCFYEYSLRYVKSSFFLQVQNILPEKVLLHFFYHTVPEVDIAKWIWNFIHNKVSYIECMLLIFESCCLLFLNTRVVKQTSMNVHSQKMA